jgi:hypothetical protein
MFAGIFASLVHYSNSGTQIPETPETIASILVTTLVIFVRRRVQSTHPELGTKELGYHKISQAIGQFLSEDVSGLRSELDEIGDYYPTNHVLHTKRESELLEFADQASQWTDDELMEAFPQFFSTIVGEIQEVEDKSVWDEIQQEEVSDEESDGGPTYQDILTDAVSDANFFTSKFSFALLVLTTLVTTYLYFRANANAATISAVIGVAFSTFVGRAS